MLCWKKGISARECSGECPGRDSNPNGFGPADFKSAASTSFATGAIVSESSEKNLEELENPLFPRGAVTDSGHVFEFAQVLEVPFEISHKRLLV